MSTWSVNNRACTSTWMALRVLAQHGKAFPNAGALAMRQLAYWNPAATPEMRALQAKTLAKQLDNVFRLVDGAELESGVKGADAVRAIEEVLVDADRTVAELAEVNDGNYRFWGEGT